MNIYKLIKSVKEGSLSGHSFNLRVKKAQGYAPDDWSDEAIEWRLKQKNDPQQTAVQEHPINPEPSAPQGIQPMPSKTISEDDYIVLDSWCRNERRELEHDANYPIETIKEKGPDSSLVSAAPGVYRIIKNNPLMNQELVNMIVKNTGVKDPEKASVFVEFMKAKSQNLLEQLDDNSYQAKADAELKKQEEDAEAKKRRDRERAMKEDPYSIAIPLPDPALDQVFDQKWYNSSDEEKAAVYDLIGNFSRDPNQPSLASSYRFGAPEKGQVMDQRLSFFLSYPQYLQGVMDDRLIKVLSEEMPKMGLSIGSGSAEDIMAGLKGIGGEGVAARSKGRIVKILNNEKGTELFGILSNLIRSGSPDIYKWLEPVIKDRFGRYQERSYDDTPEGSQSVLNRGIDENSSTQKVEKAEADIYEEHASSQILGNIGREYISPILKKSKKVMRGAIGDMLTSTADQYKNASASNVKKKALEDFGLAEILNAFSIPIIDHLNDLFSGKSKKIKGGNDKEGLLALYSNEKGRVVIPQDVVKDIYKPTTEEEKAMGIPSPEIDDYAGLVQRYMMRMKNGTVKKYTPEWRNIISNQYPKNILENMGKLKEEMRDMAKSRGIVPGESSLDVIRQHFDRIEDPNKSMSTLAEFAGVKDDDPMSVRNAKMNDYIYMTLSQDNYSIEWLQNLGYRKQGRDTVSPNQAFHNLKSYIGDKYHKFLGYLANKKSAAVDDMEEYERLIHEMTYNNHQPTPKEIKIINDVDESKNYTDDALSTIVGLLDHHGDIRNFLRNGSSINAVDKKHRTNTELYYDLKGEEPPDYIKALFEIRNAGLVDSGKIDNKTGQPKISPSSWYGALFREYGKFDPVIRGLETAQEALEKQNKKEEEHYQKYNNSLALSLNNPKTKPPDLGYRNRLKDIPEVLPEEDIAKGGMTRDMVNQQVENWMMDPSQHLDPKIYSLLGFKKFQPRLDAILERKDQIENGYVSSRKKPVKGVIDYQQESAEIKENLREILEQNSGDLAQKNINIDTLLPRLRLASEEYNRILVKIAALENMNKMKFASVGYTDYIDLQIAMVKTDFDHYFNSLFL